MRYFLDTYAIIEIVKGNPAFSKYLDFECKTSIFNLYETVYQLMRMMGEEIAVEKFNEYLRFKMELEDEWLIDAAKFRLQNKSKDVSYTDCIGYIAALKTSMIFLTGDKEFKNMPNVEFVK